MHLEPDCEGASIMAPGSVLVLDPSSSDSHRRSYVWLPIIMSTSKTDIPISTQSDLKSTQNKCHKCQYDIVIRLKKVTAASKTSQILK